MNIAGTIMFFEPDPEVLVAERGILPSIVKNDEPDRGDIEPVTEFKKDYPRLVKKSPSIEAIIRK
ncbi:hypothetical protein ATG_12870 [Desulfurococcaceae archaeon AG1]|nr:MAG: hypothetical protein DJ555_04070 [Desulfurococcaceae archaeon]GAY26084.1 hypothetical protein ATG_12870 [Desulfurococcaceae archaeon AG1]